MTQSSKNFLQYFTLFSVASICLLSATSYLWAVGSRDFYHFWVASCQLSQTVYCSEISPADQLSAENILNIYPPWAGFLFQHIAGVSYRHSNWLNNSFIVLSTSIAFATLTALFRLPKLKPLLVGVILVVLCLFAPLRDLYRSGQFTWVQLLSLTAFLFYFSKHQNFKFKSQTAGYLAGACLSISFIKPQALFLLYFYVGLLIIYKRDYRILAGGCLGLLLLMVISPGDYSGGQFQGLSSKLEYLLYWDQALLADLVFPKSIYARFGILAVSVSAIILLFRKLRDPLRASFLIIVPLSLLSTPYAFCYDLVLLLPTLVYLIGQPKYQMPLILALILAYAVNYYFLFSQQSCAVYAGLALVLGVLAYRDIVVTKSD